MKAPEIETKDTIRGIINVFASIDKELHIEHMRQKRQYLEKWGLKEIRTNKPRTALEQ
jgi:hypothetical protein